RRPLISFAPASVTLVAASSSSANGQPGSGSLGRDSNVLRSTGRNPGTAPVRRVRSRLKRYTPSRATPYQPSSRPAFRQALTTSAEGRAGAFFSPAVDEAGSAISGRASSATRVENIVALRREGRARPNRQPTSLAGAGPARTPAGVPQRNLAVRPIANSGAKPR